MCTIFRGSRGNARLSRIGQKRWQKVFSVWSFFVKLIEAVLRRVRGWLRFDGRDEIGQDRDSGEELRASACCDFDLAFLLLPPISIFLMMSKTKKKAKTVLFSLLLTSILMAKEDYIDS